MSQLGFEAVAMFTELEPPAVRTYERASVIRGVLTRSVIVPYLPKDGWPDPTLAMAFLTTPLAMPHADICYWATHSDGAGPSRKRLEWRPVHTCRTSGTDVRYAARYTTGKGRPYDTAIELDIGMWATDVAEHPDYYNMRSTVALGIAAVLWRRAGRESPLRLIIRNNFENPRLLRILPCIEAESLGELDDQLAKPQQS